MPNGGFIIVLPSEPFHLIIYKKILLIIMIDIREHRFMIIFLFHYIRVGHITHPDEQGRGFGRERRASRAFRAVQAGVRCCPECRGIGP